MVMSHANEIVCVDFRRKRRTRKALRAHVERLSLSCPRCSSVPSLHLLVSHFGVSSTVAACRASDPAARFWTSGVDQRSVCPCLHCCLTTECEAGLEQQQQQQLQLSVDREKKKIMN